jgi:hypothetical protein
MTVPTPTPILSNNANTVAVPVINQNIGVLRNHSTSDTPKRNQVKNACSKFSICFFFNYLYTNIYI